MHPADFVRTKINEGRINEIVALLHQFRSGLDALKTAENFHIFNFAILFLISVSGQLRLLEPDQDLHDDRLLTVWAELGYFGIERDRLPDDSEE